MKKLFALLLVIVLTVGCTPREVQPADLPMPEEQPTAAAQPASEPEPVPESEPEPSVATVITAGDNLIHAAVYMDAADKAGGDGYDFSANYEPIRSIVESYDVGFINIESLVSDTLQPSHYPSFCSPPEVAQAVYDVGFRVFNLSNNHTYDRGNEGLSSTVNFWQNQMPSDIAFTGVYNEELTGYAPYEVNGITFSFLGYTQHTNGIPTPSGAPFNVVYTDNLEQITADVQKARAETDVVAVSLHWGNEDSHVVADYQRELAQLLCDLGVDVIIGHHPHVLQPIEWYESADGHRMLCIYSLANFHSGQDRPANSFAQLVGFKVTKEQDRPAVISEVVSHPILTHYESGYSNYTTYPLEDYTQELLDRHSIPRSYSQFNIDWMWQTYEEIIAEEFRV